MDGRMILALIVGAIWGALWALFIERTRSGKFIAARLTWLSVVIGVGVDLLIAMLVIDFEAWWRVVAIISASSIAIIARSLNHETNDHFELIERTNGQQNTSRQ